MIAPFSYDAPEGRRTIEAGTVLSEDVGPSMGTFRVDGLQAEGWVLVVGYNGRVVIPRTHLSVVELIIDAVPEKTSPPACAEAEIVETPVGDHRSAVQECLDRILDKDGKCDSCGLDPSTTSDEYECAQCFVARRLLRVVALSTSQSP